MSRLIMVATDTDTDFEQRVRDAMGASDTDLPSLPERVVRTALLEADTDPADVPEVVLLGTGSCLDARLELASEFDRRCPQTSVIVVGDPDPLLWSRALSAGARDVLAPQADVDEIRGVLERAQRTAIGRRGAASSAITSSALSGEQAHVITVVSPKGGAGKTTVATNLAVGIAATAPGETVLVDLDLQFGDVASSLRLDPDHSVLDAVGGLAVGDSMVLKTYLDAHPSGCYALCAPASPADGDRIAADQITGLIERLAIDFRYVIVDTAPGLTEHTLAALERSTDVVLVAGMDVRSVRGLRKELDVLDELGMTRAERHVVLNFVDKHSGLRLDDVEAAVGARTDVRLPRTRATALSANRGVPLLQERTRDPVARALQRFVDLLVPVPASPGRAPRRSRRIAR